jgi:hypothetical protein
MIKNVIGNPIKYNYKAPVKLVFSSTFDINKQILPHKNRKLTIKNKSEILLL